MDERKLRDKEYFNIDDITASKLSCDIKIKNLKYLFDKNPKPELRDKIRRLSKEYEELLFKHDKPYNFLNYNTISEIANKIIENTLNRIKDLEISRYDCDSFFIYHDVEHDIYTILYIHDKRVYQTWDNGIVLYFREIDIGAIDFDYVYNSSIFTLTLAIASMIYKSI